MAGAVGDRTDKRRVKGSPMPNESSSVMLLKALLLVTAAVLVVAQTSTSPSPTDDKDVASLLAGMDEATMNRRSVRTILSGLHRVSERDFSQQESCMVENLRVVADAKNAECFYVCLGLPGGLARKGCCAPGSQFLLPNATNVLGDCSLQPTAPAALTVNPQPLSTVPASKPVTSMSAGASPSSAPSQSAAATAPAVIERAVAPVAAPTFTCPAPVQYTAPQCGDEHVSLLLSVGGDGSCTLMTITNGMQIISTCQQNIFNTNCGSFNGTLQILLTNPSQADPQNYKAPDIQSYLNALGLGSITTIGSLSLKVYGFTASSNAAGTLQASPIPVDLSVSLLPNLAYVTGGLLITEFTGGASYPSRFSALSSFGSFKQTAGTLEVNNTALTNLTTFATGGCGPKEILIFGNSKLSSLDGLDKMDPANGLARISIINNNLLNSPSTFSALTRLLLCSGGSTSLNVPSFQVLPGGCSYVITSAAAMCAYIAGSEACPVDQLG